MSSNIATRDEIRALLGDVDDLILERVVETGASIDEIAEALREFENEDDVAFVPPSSSHVIEVRALLRELADDNDDDFVISHGEVRDSNSIR